MRIILKGEHITAVLNGNFTVGEERTLMDVRVVDKAKALQLVAELPGAKYNELVLSFPTSIIQSMDNTSEGNKCGIDLHFNADEE